MKSYPPTGVGTHGGTLQRAVFLCGDADCLRAVKKSVTQFVSMPLDASFIN